MRLTDNGKEKQNKLNWNILLSCDSCPAATYFSHISSKKNLKVKNESKNTDSRMHIKAQ